MNKVIEEVKDENDKTTFIIFSLQYLLVLSSGISQFSRSLTINVTSKSILAKTLNPQVNEFASISKN